MALGSGLAGIARVAFEANTASFHHDLTQIEAAYNQTLDRMRQQGARGVDLATRTSAAEQRLAASRTQSFPSQIAQSTALKVDTSQSVSEVRKLSSAEQELREQAKMTGAALEHRLNTDKAEHEVDQLTKSEKDLARQAKETQRDLENSFRGVLGGTRLFRGLGGSIAYASAAFFGGAGLTIALKTSINEARDLREEVDKVKVVFGDSAREVLAWGRDTNRTLGLSQLQALRSAGSFGAMFKALGLTDRQASSMSRTFVKLGVDMGSFANEEPADMLDRLRSALAGEAEPLRRFGVLINDTTVKQAAYAAGIAKSGANLTEQQKVLARYALILKQTAIQQGNFELTSGSLANQERILSANLSQIEVLIGRALLPTVLKLVTQLNDWLEKSENQKRIQHDVNEVVKQGTSIVKGIAAAIDGLLKVVKPLVTLLGGVEHAMTLAFGVALIVKIRKVATAMGLISTASGAARVRGVADAEAFGAAWDYATRPRTMIVNTPTGPGGVPAPVPTAPGGGGRGVPPVPVPVPRGGVGRFFGRIFGRRGPSVVERIGQYGRGAAPVAGRVAGAGIALGGAASFALGGLTLFQQGEQGDVRFGFDPATDRFYMLATPAALKNPENRRFWQDVPGGESAVRKVAPDVWRQAQTFRRSKSAPNRTFQFGLPAFLAGAKALGPALGVGQNTTTGATTKTPDPLEKVTLPSSLSLREAKARRSQSQTAIAGALTAEKNYYEWVLRTKKLTADAETSAINAITSIDSELQGIKDQAEQKAQAAAAAEKARQEKAAQRAKDQREAALTLPQRLQTAEARNQVTDPSGIGRQSKQTFLAERRFYRGLLQRAKELKLTLEERKTIYGELDRVQGELDSLESSRKAKRDKLRADKLEREDLLFENALAKSEGTPKPGDDVRVLSREKARLEKRLAPLKAKKKLTNEELAQETQLINDINDLRDRIAAKRKDLSPDGSGEDLDRTIASLVQGMADVAKYAPNFWMGGQQAFTPTSTGGRTTGVLEDLTRQQTEVVRRALNRGYTDDPVLRRDAEAAFS